MTDLCKLQEMVIAKAHPKVIPLLTVCDLLLK